MNNHRRKQLKGYNFEFNKFKNPKIFDNQDKQGTGDFPPVGQLYLFQNGEQYLFQDGTEYEFN